MLTKLIIGLGNPTEEYKDTRHNIGFTVLNTLSKKYKISKKKEKKLLCWYGHGKTENYNIILAWPTTYMNNSGNAVVKLLNYFKIDSKDLIVVHDEVALNLGKIRIVFNSSAAGHHGVESIIQSLGGVQEFTRLRVGIGPDPGGDIRADYVLRKFTPNEEKLVKKVVDISVDAIEIIINENIEKAMNKFNGVEIKV
ncbi:MAG: aminoacyl-tRNA hydrolase [Candidatus Melainabacteria bacterium]|nr:aminoacyl-tRNA hydrolase [Candidatus Melainabacteria bacterium]